MPIQKQATRYASGGINDYDADTNMDTTDTSKNDTSRTSEEKFPFWERDQSYTIKKMLKGLNRKVKLPEVLKELKEEKDTLSAICLYRFASNFNGGTCKGYVVGGVCLYHWQNMGIGFMTTNANVLDNIEDGSSRTVRNRLTPYILSTYGKGVFVIAPLIRSIKFANANTNLEQLFSALNQCFTVALNGDEANAMAKGLMLLLFSEKRAAALIRDMWIEQQKHLCKVVDPRNIYQLMVQESEASKLQLCYADDFSIFDSPMLLTLGVSTSIRDQDGHNVTDYANIGIIQVNRKVPMGVFALVGPIIYSPIINKDTQNAMMEMSIIPQQHLFVVPKLLGVTLSPDQTACTLELSTVEQYMVNVQHNKQLTSEQWEDSFQNLRYLKSHKQKLNSKSQGSDDDDDVGMEDNEEDEASSTTGGAAFTAKSILDT